MAELPSGINRVVVFDTNAYRKLCLGLSIEVSKNKTKQLLPKERMNNTVGIANLYTVMKLVAHLGDKTDPHYYNCLSALVSLGTHTWMNNGIRMIPDSTTTVCMELFGKVPAGHQQALDATSSLVGYIMDHALNIDDDSAQKQIKLFKHIIDKNEKLWVDTVKAGVEKCDPKGAKDWEIGKGDKLRQKKLRTLINSDNFLSYFAGLLLPLYANQVNVCLELHELSEKTEHFIKVFETPLHLITKIWTKVATCGGYTLQHPKEKRGNYLWDFSIAFAIGGKHSIGGTNLFLVTDDKRIKEAACETQCGDRVLKLSEYLDSIGIQEF